MDSLARRASLICLALTVILLCGTAAFAQPAAVPAMPEDVRLLPYIEPGRRIDVGGRHINLRCSGTGIPTVVLMAGLSSWSPVWYKTQPAIAKRTRVCAFDRAGYGFSDPAPQLQILPGVVDDLHAALKAAEESGPYILVGHSLGGLEARLFTQRWPEEVVGMVLVDTSPAAEMLIEANIPGVDDALSMELITPARLRCVLLAGRGVEPSSHEYRDCVQPLPSDAPNALRRVWPMCCAAVWHASQLSLLSSLTTHRYNSADHLDLGEKPLVVLSLDLCCLGNSPAENFWRNYKKTWYAQHEMLARLSSRGMHRIVDGAGHQIQLDKPQAVIDAVEEVLGKLSAGRSPPR